MENIEIMKEMEALVKKLNEASDVYYNSGTEIMSNQEWDQMFNKLTEYENATGVVLPNSPTHNVGSAASSGFKEVKHEFPALSLDKSQDINDLIKWADNRPVWLSLKLDGSTVVLTYDNGKLTKMVTRGDGITGQDVTVLADGIKSIPKEISFKGHLVLRGEAIMSYSDFENYILVNECDNPNPRNLSNGSFNYTPDIAKRIKLMQERNIQWQCFTPTFIEGNTSNSWGQRMEFVHSLGFKTVSAVFVPDPANNLKKAINFLSEQVDAGKIDEPVDGLVICYDDWAYSISGKNTGHHSKTGGFAFKWKDKPVASVIRDIEWSCATNVITPVAIFDPIYIEGTTVTRASLCNISECKRLGVGINSNVDVIKANKIIPKIVKASPGDLIIPKTCPVCGALTEIKVTGDRIKTESLICTNPECVAKNISKLTRFVNKHGLDIDDLSVSTLRVLINKGWIHSFSDIYNLAQHQKEWEQLPGFGQVSVGKILKNIEASKTTNFDSFIYALSIPGIGREQAKLLHKYIEANISKFTPEFPEITGLNLIGELAAMVRNNEDFTAIDGFGEVYAEAVTKWSKENLLVPDSDAVKLIKVLSFNDKASETADSSIKGLTFVVTGDVHHYKNRDELKAYIESCGGKVAGSISKKTAYLINNDINSTSGKNQKAKELGIPIISEDEFVSKFC